jgi:TonB-dependent receptor
MTPSKIRFLIGASLALACTALFAQPPGTGTISGRIFNPATQEYIRNAEVKIQGTNLGTATEAGGYYELRNVPAGTVQVVASYPGAESVTAPLTVTAGGRVTKDFELSLITDRARAAGDEEIIQLETFVVESEREGQSKMVAEQKQAMNIKQVVSADNFGDMSEQNIGEFLKYLPGITIDYVETDTRAASLGGMDPKYGYVTLDGNAQASGGSGSFGGNDRQFEFESVSMNNIESIEVNKTLTPEMWGDAPAGTVNLRTRSALDRKSPKGSVTAGVIWNSLENGFKKTPRPDDGVHAKTRPRLSFDYSTGAILGGKFGLSVNGAFSNIYKEQFRHSIGYDYNSTQAQAAGVPLVNRVNFKDGPKLVEKSGGGLKLDFQPVPGLRMTVSGSYTYFDDFFANRNLNFITTSANLLPGSSMTRIVARNSNNGNTRVEQSGESTGKRKDNTNLSYMVNFKRGPWTADLNLLYSRARERRGGNFWNAMGRTDIRLNNIGFTAERSSIDSGAWNIVQTGGPDWYDWRNWGSNDQRDVQTNSQYGKTEQYTARLDVKRAMDWAIPTSFKAGLGRNVAFKHRWVMDSFRGRFVGTTGNALTAVKPQSRASFLIDEGFGGGVAGLPVPDKEAYYAIYRNNPEQFTQTERNRADDLNDILSSFRGNQEDVRAGYVMQESRVGRWQLLGGVRLESTRTRSTVPGEIPGEDNLFPANTREFVYYRWSPGKVTTYGEYHDWLPSAAAKFTISENTFLKLGYNKAIKRPDLNRISGPWEIDINENPESENFGEIEVTVPNPSLKPERSERFSVMMEHYFKSAGTASIHVFQTDIKNAIDNTADNTTGADIGITDPRYSGYFFKTFFNLEEKRRIRGIELSYSQPLRFFENKFVRATTVFATYTQTNAVPRPRNGTRYFPRSATGGVTWSYGKFFFQVNGTWTDETFSGSNTVPGNSVFAPNEPEYFKPRTILFVNARYRINDTFSVFVSGDRAYDSGKIWYYKSDNRIRQIENYGSQWSVGMKADF